MPLGFHVSKSKTVDGKKKSRSIPAALREDIEWLRGFGITSPCAQIFVSGPQNFNETLTDEDKIATRRFVNETGTQIVIHGAYVDHPWNRAPGAVHNIKQEMRTAARIGATGVVVHLGAGATNDENLTYVFEEIAKLSDDVLEVTTLWLEIHTAKPGNNTFETPQKLNRLFDRIGRVETGKLRIGLCIDTAHLFSCGVALDTYEAATNWLAGLPRDVPVMMHLNDSASSLGSGVDRHETLCEGKLWSQYHPETGRLPIENSGLVAILNWAETNDIMTILERDEEGTIHDLTLIQTLGYFQD
jgi:endonuclease IV